MKHASLMLAILAFGHFVVDTIASTVNPIWPNLEDQLGMARGDFLAIGYLCWITTNSFAQILFGYLGDRVRCRWLIWFGPVVSIVCLALLGWIHSTWLMCLTLFLAGLGIAAFHPEAAATAGSLLPHNRSRAMAIFALCGYLGQAVGPTYAGELVAYDGITTLAWHLVWALPAMLIVALGIQGRQFPLQSGSQTPPRIRDIFSGRGMIMLKLFAGGVLRIIPALGIPLTLAYLLEAEGLTTDEIGPVQSSFMAGIGAGAIICALVASPRWERSMLWLPTLLATPFVVLVGPASYAGKIVLCLLAGLLLGIAMPVFISYAQRLIPRGPRIASSLTMGASWGVASILVAGLIRLYQNNKMLDQVFWIFAAACVACSIVCLALPDIEESLTDDLSQPDDPGRDSP